MRVCRRHARKRHLRASLTQDEDRYDGSFVAGGNTSPFPIEVGEGPNLRNEVWGGTTAQVYVSLGERTSSLQAGVIDARDRGTTLPRNKR